MNLVDRKRHIGITAKNVLPYLVFALLVLIYSTAAQALNGPCNSPNIQDGAFSYTNLNRLLSIKSNTPIYSQIGSEIIVYGNLINCFRQNGIPDNSALSYSISSNYPAIKIGDKTVVPTSIPGIGVAVGIEQIDFCPPNGTYWINNTTYNDRVFVCDISKIKLNGMSHAYYHYIFYKLSDNIPSSGTLQIPYVYIAAYYTTGSSNTDYSFSSNITTQFSFSSVPTCTVSTPSITVPLNNMLSSNFKGVGSVSATQNFQIGLSCSGGNSGTSSNTYITFTDNNQPGNTSTTLTLAGGTGAATGLGLQILNNGTPIGYGPDSNAPGNTNQWKVANIAQGVSSYLIPLGVRYIQTGSTVTPGTVTGRATFTMSYQ